MDMQSVKFYLKKPPQNYTFSRNLETETDQSTKIKELKIRTI